jgi:predicted DNA-binding protein (MmcQ/YjbR family)
LSRITLKNAALDKFCRSLPGTTMSVQWRDHQVYKVGGKMFAVVTDRGTVSFKMLVETGQASPSPYMTRAQWLYVDDLKQFPVAELRQYIAASHALVAKKLTKKVQRALGLATG